MSQQMCSRCDVAALRNSEWCLECWRTWFEAKRLYTMRAISRDEASRTRSKS